MSELAFEAQKKSKKKSEIKQKKSRKLEREKISAKVQGKLNLGQGRSLWMTENDTFTWSNVGDSNDLDREW